MVGCHNNQQYTKHSENKIKSNECFVYPPIIDSLQIRDLYDSARWYVYSLYCDKPYQPKKDSLKILSFGQLQLKFDNLIVKDDTLQLNYNFIDKGQIVLPSVLKVYKPLITGVGFNKKTRKKIYMESPSGFSIVMSGGLDNRFENPMQPEVISYIKSNWDKLDKCFRELAVQKGVTK